MIPVYEEQKDELYIIKKRSKHIPPHLHNTIEFIYLTSGSLELGIGQEFYHMEEGDFAVIFPDVIHHYQVFSSENSKDYYIWALPLPSDQFNSILQNYCPENPVIKKENLHIDIKVAVQRLWENYREDDEDSVVNRSYIQILLARSIKEFHMVEKSSVESNDIIYQTIAYIARNFKRELSLDIVSKELGINKYSLSRVFSGTFHRNFNQYLNEQRLNYATSLLEFSDKRITDICLDAGFESQRTFNRTFREKYKMTPREYRELCQKQKMNL